MNQSRFILFALITAFVFTGRIISAQNDNMVRDFLYIGIDPQTLKAGQNSDLYLVRSDGSRMINLTNTPLDSENQAFWSADGKHIYFSRNSVAIYPGSPTEQSSTSFYEMSISDTGEKISERLLFHLSDVLGKPMRVDNWLLSPNEQKALLIPNDESLVGTYIVNMDGTDLRERIAKGVASNYIWPRWSPDSKEFAYKTSECLRTTSNYACPYWVIQVEGNQQPEQINTEQDLMNHWHSNGFYVVAGPTNFELYQANKVIWTGSERPHLAPNGSTVAFSDNDVATSTGRLKTADIKTNNPAQIIQTDGAILLIEWSPDSRQIAFGAYKGSFNDFEVYTVRPDGSGLTKLFQLQSWNRNPLAWRPDRPSNGG